jgi:hypothetical protein
MVAACAPLCQYVSAGVRGDLSLGAGFFTRTIHSSYKKGDFHMAEEPPDYEDAELTLKLYDLRRETVMRESRNAINGKFWPKTYEDVMAVAKPDNPLNAPFRQVSSYWEMVYGMAKHGIAHPDFLIENNGEGLFLLAKMQPFLEQYRKDMSPFAFRNAEWITKNCEEGKKRFEVISARVKKVMESK